MSNKVIQPVIAKSEDGTIQITFTIAFEEIKKVQEDVLADLRKETEVPGFRRGMAPLSKVKERTSENSLLEKTLSKILPKLVSDVAEKNKLELATYPKFELIKAKEGEDWQIRAVTCEVPKVELGDYKNLITAQKNAPSIWTPGKNKSEKGPNREEKEQAVLKALIEGIKVKIPKILIDQEVDSRLSNLLQRLEKLGLSLESYLSSIKKTAENLRKDYEKEVSQALTLDLILTKIAQIENIQVQNEDIDAAINASKVDQKLNSELKTPERRRFIEVILKRRKALDFLISLV